MRNFSPDVFLWQVPMGEVLEMMTEFTVTVASVVSYYLLG